MAAFIRVAKASEIPTETGKLVEVGGKQIALFQVDGLYYALDNTCTHRGGPLSEGETQGKAVQCPWHGAQFSLETGEALAPPATVGVSCYPVRQQGDDIEIEI